MTKLNDIFAIESAAKDHLIQPWDEIKSLGLRGIYLGNYDPWNQSENTKMMIEKFGFETFQTRQTTFKLDFKIEDFFQNIYLLLRICCS